MSPADYENLGAFYLGRTLDPTSGSPAEAPLLYPSKHLVTHGVIVGMTGSGKTGLGTVLLEEAAIDGIPSIVVDPKGDLGNLMLTFPSLDPQELAPWAPPGEDPAVIMARHVRGLEESGQDAARIARFAGSVERTLYTPGSSAGRPLALLPVLSAPKEADAEATRDRAVQASTTLLTLAGVDPDPRTSAAHTLVANILLAAWAAGRDLDVSTVIREIQRPPFDRIGALDLETVISTKDRTTLAGRLNIACSSPAFADFMVGEPLDVGRLLYTLEGRPRMSILSIAHLADADRMAFVTLLLGELIRWMRSQQGTSSLRALFYMDEVFGYFPPVAAPPAKAPMLTLLKQARAFGLGIVLATQNPVDLDYKGLSNAGTWMLGRLPTERDKLRVLEGLEGASSASGVSFDRGRVDAVLSTLRPRTFVLHDVNEPDPRLFETRWALSYMRGPLSRDEMRRLAAPTHPDRGAVKAPPPPSSAHAASSTRPALPADVPECFLVRADVVGADYRAGLLCRASLRFVDAKAGIDTWVRPTLVAPLSSEGPRWADAWVLDVEPATSRQPAPGATYGVIPSAAMRAATYAVWRKALSLHLLRERPLTLPTAPALRLTGLPGEARDVFVARVAQTMRERRDREVESLAAKWQPKIEKTRDRLEAARHKLEDATADRNTQAFASSLEVGATVLGAMFGRRSALRGASSVATKARRAQRKQMDRERAQANIADYEAELRDMERNLAEALETLKKSWDPSHVAIEERSLTPRKSDLTIDRFELVWVPVAG